MGIQKLTIFLSKLKISNYNLNLKSKNDLILCKYVKQPYLSSGKIENELKLPFNVRLLVITKTESLMVQKYKIQFTH